MIEKSTDYIDILIPYWGDFQLLKQAVDSIFAQTDARWHLTILDDHYPSEDAYNYYKNLNDQRFTYIRHSKNLGITANFNFAIKTAAAPYCMIMGCDDRLLPSYVKTALRNIGAADFYQPRVSIISAKGIAYLPLGDRVKRLLQPRKSGLYRGEKLAVSLCHGDWLYFPAITWNTKFLKEYSFNTEYKIVEDLDLIIRMLIDGASLYFDTTVTFQYRRFNESLSSKEKQRGGVRFHEESAAYANFARKFASIGWKKAELAAKFHITSRINRFITR